VAVGGGCVVESDRWLDPYTKRTYTDPLGIDIDHLVPLANAYRSGASEWDEAERERRQRPRQPPLRRGQHQPGEGGQGPRGLEAAQPGHLVLVREALDRRQIRLRPDHQPAGEGGPETDARDLREEMTGFTSTTGGVMTEEAGAITGELELLCRPGADGLQVPVRYASADEWYTVSGSPVQVQGNSDDVMGRVVGHLSTPGPVVDGNEKAVTLEGFPRA